MQGWPDQVGLVEFSRFNHHFCHELIQKVYSRKNTDRFVPFKVSWSFIFRIDSKPGIGTKNKIGIHFIHQRIAEIQKFTVTKKLKELILQREFGKGFDFHMRNAGLDFKEVQIISNAMMKATKHGILNLKSFSLSYNPEITDQGVVLLVKAFPPQITELGLVGCDLGDEAGEGIYQYLKNSSLELVCIEGNNFSTVLMEKFKNFVNRKPI